MWRLTRFPTLKDGQSQCHDERLFLGWKDVLVYRNAKLLNLVTGAELFAGPLEGCSLSRDFCAILQAERCRVFSLYDSRHIEVPIEAVQEVSMLERSRVALRTPNEVVVFDLQAKSFIKRWPLVCSRISAGFDHLVALSTNGQVHVWGDGSRGQQGSGLLEFSEDLRPVEDLEEVTMAKIAAGGWHTTALSSRGFVYQWGWNQHGQSGGPQISPRVREGSLPVVASPALRQFGSAPVVDIACGSRHSIALTKDGSVYSWGWNEYGQCDLPGPQPEPGDQRKNEMEPTEAAGAGDVLRLDGQGVGQGQGRRPVRVLSAYWTSAIGYD